MRLSKGKSPYIVYVITVLLLVGGAFSYTSSSSEAMLPEGLIIEDIFKPGHGSPVGMVLLVQGKVVIMHENIVRGYWAKKDLPLFKGDTIITREKGRIRFELIDGSIMTLSSRTKLVINRSVYDRVKKSRFSFLKMTLGKARFWTKKLLDLKYSEFKVKTHTLVVGVRGSDFIIRATPKLTEVTALEKTELEVVSLAFPEAKPMIVTDFERTIVEEGALPTEAEMLAPEEIEQIKEEFTVTPERAEPEGKVEVGKEKAEKKEGDGEEGDEGDSAEGTPDENAGEEDVSAEGAVEEAPIEESIVEEGISDEIPVLVSDDELVMPEDLGELEEFEEPLLLPDIVDVEEVPSQEGEVVEQQEEIYEEQHEETIAEEELPSLPGAPE